MRRKRTWSAERDRTLVRLYDFGFGLEEMADELGIDAETVNQRLRELDRRPRPTAGRRANEEEADLIDAE